MGLRIHPHLALKNSRNHINIADRHRFNFKWVLGQNSDVRALNGSQTACFSLDAQNLGGIQRYCLKRLLWRQSLCRRHDFALSIHSIDGDPHI